MVEIVFTKDFASKKKGDVLSVRTSIARRLINRKVAKFNTKKEEKPDK